MESKTDFIDALAKRRALEAAQVQQLLATSSRRRGLSPPPLPPLIVFYTTDSSGTSAYHSASELAPTPRRTVPLPTPPRGHHSPSPSKTSSPAGAKKLSMTKKMDVMPCASRRLRTSQPHCTKALLSKHRTPQSSSSSAQTGRVRRARFHSPFLPEEEPLLTYAEACHMLDRMYL